MSTIAKKIFVAVVAAVVVATVAVPSAQAQTVEELQAQISALLAQIQQLQSQLAAVSGGTTGGGVSGIPAGFMFNTNLTVGSTGTDVMYLQMALNAWNDSPIATSGAGSPGNETSYFGPITAGGVTAFQNKYASEILTPVGLTSGTGFFGPSSRAKANALLAATPGTPTPGTPSPTPGISTPGAEGFITVQYAPSPITGEDFDAGSTGQTIMGVEVEANNSDVIVNRVDVNFTTRPWLNIAKIAIADGSTVVATMDVTSANTIENTVGSSYTIRVTGLNVLVPMGATKVLNVMIDPILQAGDATETLSYEIPVNGVRATDGAGLTQEAPSTDLGSNRSFIVETSADAALEFSTHADNPDEDFNAKVNKTTTTEGITLLMFNLEAETGGSVVRSVSGTPSVASGTVVMKLYDGSTLLDSASVAAGATTVDFDNFSVSISEGTTKTLSIKADVPAGNTGGTASVSVAAANIVAEDASDFTSVTPSGSTVSGGTARFFYEIPTLALNGTPTFVHFDPAAEASNTIAADFTIRINVTADGGDIFVASTTSFTASSSAADSTVTLTNLTSDANEQGNGNWLVSNGQTKYFELTGRVTNTDTTAVTARAFLKSISWGNDSAASDVAQTWGLEDFETSSLILEVPN